MPAMRRSEAPGKRKAGLRVIPFAYQEIGCAGLGELIKMGAEIPFVVTHRDDPGEKIWFRSVRDLARRKGIPVFYAEDMTQDEMRRRVEKAGPDLIVSLYYRRLLREEIFSVPRLGSVNLHGSFLPYYRGRCPVNWVLVKGEKKTGLTFHFMTKRPD